MTLERLLASMRSNVENQLVAILENFRADFAVERLFVIRVSRREVIASIFFGFESFVALFALVLTLASVLQLMSGVLLRRHAHFSAKVALIKLDLRYKS